MTATSISADHSTDRLRCAIEDLCAPLEAQDHEGSRLAKDEIA